MSAGLIFALVCAILAIVYGAISSQWILAQPSGNDRMREISGAIQEGAKAYLNRQYTTIGIAGIVLAVIIWLTSSARPHPLSLSQVRSAVAVMAGGKAITLRWVKTGATAWRCHFQSAPSALNRLLPIAGRSIRFMISDLG